MCGRFVIYAEKDDVSEMFNVRTFLSSYKSSYNVAPSQIVPVLIEDNTLTDMKWGLQLGKINLINTRVETLEKPFFKSMQHCIIIANGFYEWKDKEPRYITLKNRKLFGLAGIYHDDKVSIITTNANKFMKNIHDRMPVIIPHGSEEEWIKTKSFELLKPSNEELMAVKVSAHVNSPKYNSPDCIKAI